MLVDFFFVSFYLSFFFANSFPCSILLCLLLHFILFACDSFISFPIFLSCLFIVFFSQCFSTFFLNILHGFSEETQSPRTNIHRACCWTIAVTYCGLTSLDSKAFGVKKEVDVLYSTVEDSKWVSKKR